jgi:predicted nucleic acid-binding protein
VYARDSSEPDKQRRAAQWMEELWRSRSGRISQQVLHEYYVTVTRKLNPGLSPAIARQDVRALLQWSPIPADGELLDRAWLIEDRYRLAFWDALIVAAAVAAGGRILLSEDMQEGAEIEGVLIVNPFRTLPGDDQVHDE